MKYKISSLLICLSILIQYASSQGNNDTYSIGGFYEDQPNNDKEKLSAPIEDRVKKQRLVTKDISNDAPSEPMETICYNTRSEEVQVIEDGDFPHGRPVVMSIMQRAQPVFINTIHPEVTGADINDGGVTIGTITWTILQGGTRNIVTNVPAYSMMSYVWNRAFQRFVDWLDEHHQESDQLPVDMYHFTINLGESPMPTNFDCNVDWTVFIAIGFLGYEDDE